jgi:hypothetical protein
MALKIGRSVSEKDGLPPLLSMTRFAIDAQTDHGRVIIQGSLWLKGSLPRRMSK